MVYNTQDVDRKVLSILRVLGNSRDALGARVIARSLKDLGVELGERAVRYHLKITDQRGLTRLVGRRDGRVITDLGQAELKKALVSDKVGFALSRIETLTFRTTFDMDKKAGMIPANIAFFPKDSFARALKIMKPVFEEGLCVSSLVCVAEEGENIGELIVPEGNVALATVCSILVNAALLKAGIPVDSRFGGILQMQDHKPLRFTELINYAGSSLDPTEVFIRANMTSVSDVVKTGDGEILANFREIPSVCRPLAEEVSEKLRAAGLGGILQIGSVSEPVCEIHIDLNRVGIILIGGLNPVAAAYKAGITSETHAMSSLVDYDKLVKVTELR